jgi:sugar phosphate isomerase/epimerase
MSNSAHNPLGIFNSVFHHLPLREMAKTLQGYGFTHVHLSPELDSVTGSEPLDAAKARHIRQTLADHGIGVAAIAGYTNLVDPNAERRERKLQKLERLIELSHDLGSPYVATETGSVNPDNEWDDHPDNHTQAQREQMLATLDRLLRKAREHGVTLLIEGYVNNVVATTEEAVRLLDDLGPDGLGYVLDPFNYFRPEDLNRQQETLDRVFAAIAARSPIAHAKDVIFNDKGIIDTPKVGTGKLDWKLYAVNLRKHAPNVPLILEHLDAADVPGCLALVKQAFADVRGV